MHVHSVAISVARVMLRSVHKLIRVRAHPQLHTEFTDGSGEKRGR